MNDLTNLKNKKFLDKLKDRGDLGYFDYELGEYFNWKLIAVRSTAGSLKVQGFASVHETTKGWYICFIKELDVKHGAKKSPRTKTK